MSAATLTFYSETEVAWTAAPHPSLLAQARRGNREAFAEMVSPYMTTVYQRARRLTGNPTDAEDVSQEALLKAWSRLEQFSGKRGENPDDFRAWISRIGANSSIDLLRQRRDGRDRRWKSVGARTRKRWAAESPGREDNPEERCARREMGRILADAIVQLPARSAAGVPAARRAALFDARSRRAAGNFDRGRAAAAVPGAPAPARETGRAAAAAPAARKVSSETSPARVGKKRERFLPMSAAAGYACGD